MNYYIKDTTINEIVYKDSLSEMVTYLEEVCQRRFRQNRADYMTDMISLGFGYDDAEGVTFTSLLADKFEIGVKRSDGKLVRTNIHEHARNVKYRDVMGD